MLIAKMVSNLLESVWTMVGRPTVCWMRMREAMDRERGRKIISVRPSEIQIAEFQCQEFTRLLYGKHQIALALALSSIRGIVVHTRQCLVDIIRAHSGHTLGTLWARSGFTWHTLGSLKAYSGFT